MVLNYGLIGTRIREMRRLKDISQAELAEAACLSVVYVSSIENGKKKASLQSLTSITYAMGITIDSLLIGNQNRAKSEYQNDILILMEDCTVYEKRIIYEQLHALKSSLRKNRSLL